MHAWLTLHHTSIAEADGQFELVPAIGCPLPGHRFPELLAAAVKRVIHSTSAKPC